jgi:hypothetical protein
MDTTSQPLADRVLDELLPEELEWRRLISKYPWPVLAAAAAFGYFLGSRHSQAVTTVVTGYMASQVTDRLGSFLDDAV